VNTPIESTFKSPVCAWTSNADIETVHISAQQSPINGEISIPGSKSYTNRALILAAAAQGTSVITGALRSEDSYWCIEALRLLGAVIDVAMDSEQITIEGRAGHWQPAEIYIGSAGTTARFLTSVLALSTQVPIVVRASAQLSGRPMAPLLVALAQLGARFEYLGAQHALPLRILPAVNTGGETNIAGHLSSQFLSGLLMAAPLAHKAVSICVDGDIVQEDYVAMTIATMREFGVEPHQHENTYIIAPNAYTSADYAIEADASTASYFFGLAAATGGQIQVANLGRNSQQPDIQVLSIFEQLGCQVSLVPSGGVRLTGPQQLIGDQSFDMNHCSDVALTIAALAPRATGSIAITNITHIRNHECDRIDAMTQSLQTVGISVEALEDGWRIEPGAPKSTTLETYDDHRMAMSLSLLGLQSGVTLKKPMCVSKTCPDFFTMLTSLGVEVVLSKLNI